MIKIHKVFMKIEMNIEYEYYEIRQLKRRQR